jgi:hypothetical protein
MHERKRLSVTPIIPQNDNNYTNLTFSTFKYKPPNNTGVILGIIGGALATVGDALSTIGAIIQLNIDLSADFQSQVENFKSDQEKEKMREEIEDLMGQVKEIDNLKEQVKEIDNLKEQLKQLEILIKNNQK